MLTRSAENIDLSVHWDVGINKLIMLKKTWNFIWKTNAINWEWNANYVIIMWKIMRSKITDANKLETYTFLSLKQGCLNNKLIYFLDF